AYTLSFSINAVCELEDALDMPVAGIVAQLNEPEKVRMSTVRTIIWAALRDHHNEVDEKAAGAIATEAGVPTVMAKIGEALALAFPAQEGKGKPRPPKAAKRD